VPDSHERSLKALQKRGRLRTLTQRAGLDFSSNDYLGLAQSAELREAAAAALSRGVPLGAGGARLLRGNHPEHEALESEAARFFGADTALYFGGGFTANTALFATLPQRDDLVVHDALIHASVHEGVRLGRAAAVAARHNDVQSFADAIGAWRRQGGTGRAWIAVESLYSMDGDRAPLDDLMQLADLDGAMLVIDEAHATGVFGPQGRGLGAAFEGRSNVISLHTCGKALGASGALVLAPRCIRDFLVNRCRPFIYATAPSPLMAAVVRRSLELCREQPQRRELLHARIAAAARLMQHRIAAPPSGSQIQPVVVGPDGPAVALASRMQVLGFDVRAVRPPTVPEGTARLRLAITLNVTAADLEAMFDAMAACAGELGLSALLPAPSCDTPMAQARQ
jgi:8-amino-7-oxononanoate synthase